MTEKVLITGGCGFLGRGLMRRNRVDNLGWSITAMNRDEAKQIRVRAQFPETHFIKADVSAPVDYLVNIFSGYDVIIHAGANKLVDVGERSAFEVFKNNGEGSRNVAIAAIAAGVRQVIGISSDKAVQPVSTYGNSKMMMERLFQEADTLSQTQFTCPRYGNVVGSTISIFTYFAEQMAKEGYIRLTVPEMTRFYMSVDEAIDAILFSYHYAQRGSVVIPPMQSMSVGDAARLFLDLPPDYCLDLDKRVHIVGPRPGEKLHESLLHEQESVRVHTRQDVSGGYWELRPSIEGDQGTVPFTITSDKAPLGPMPFERMRALVEEAKTI